MDDAGLGDLKKLGPKPAAVHHFISLSSKRRRSIRDLIGEQGTGLKEWRAQIDKSARSVLAASWKRIR